MTFLKSNVGIDVSKDKCDCHLSALTGALTVITLAAKTFPNTEGGARELLQWLQRHRPADGPVLLHATLEATGVYHERFALALQQGGHQVSVVLPNKAKKYLESLGHKSKNDTADAKGLAAMGCQQALEEWAPLSPFYQQLRTLTRLHEDLQQKRTDTSNQLHALTHSAVVVKAAIKVLKHLLTVLDKEIAGVAKLLAAHVATDAAVSKKIENICTIKGVGLLTVATVVAETNGFELIENIPQLVSYAGYDVVDNQSGQRIGKAHISKKGNPHIRRVLYMPGLNMVTWQVGAMPALFERTLQRHGIKMKSYVALQRKLLVLMYTLWKKNEPFDNDYHKKGESSGMEEAGAPSRPGLPKAEKAAA